VSTFFIPHHAATRCSGALKVENTFSMWLSSEKLMAPKRENIHQAGGTTKGAAEIGKFQKGL